MNLCLQKGLADAYKSPAQIARVLTEDWVAKELYCPACLEKNIKSEPNNTKATDFRALPKTRFSSFGFYGG
jgi:hypothetical protein